jgi:hypothetical protein
MKNALNAATANYRQQVSGGYQQPGGMPYGWGGPAVMQGAQLGGGVGEQRGTGVPPGGSYAPPRPGGGRGVRGSDVYNGPIWNNDTPISDVVGGFDGRTRRGLFGGSGPRGTNLGFGGFQNGYNPGDAPTVANQQNWQPPFGAKTLVPNAQNLVNNTMMGGFLGPDTNPYLQGTFNRAADLTRGRLDSEFAGAGRNLGASMPARSEELQTLASNIYGGNYQAERDRQFNAVGQAESLDPLNQYFNRIAGIVPGAGGVTTSTQPYFKTGLF